MTNEEWEDYYEILGVDPEASGEEIKKAYRSLAKRLHPDRLGNRSESTRRWAEEKFKKVNRAYEVLGNPQKRQQYDAKWHQRSIKPKPVVKPQYIQFDNVEPGKIQTSSFVIRNVGGPYKKIWISNPDSWVRIVRWFSLTDSDELPLQVEIEAEGEEWGKGYTEYIRVKLDEEETKVKLSLQTKPEPVREKVRVRVRPRTRSTYTPPPPPYTSPPISMRQGMPAWAKWTISLATLGLIIGLITQFWSSTNQIVPSEDTASTPVVQSTSVTQPALRWSHPTLYIRMAIPIDLNSDGKMNEIVACRGDDRLYAFSSNGELKWVVEDESLFVLSLIPIDYNSDKKFNEILLFGLQGIGEGINIFNSHGEKIYEAMSDISLGKSPQEIESEFDEIRTKYGYKISGQIIDENFNRVDLDGNGKFDDIIRIQFEDSVGVYNSPPPDPPIEEYPLVKYSHTRETLDCSFDGGKTWETLLSVRNMPGYWNIIKSFVVRDSQYIIVFLRGHVNAQIETVDEGKTWEYILFPGRDPGSGTVRLRTRNRGETWQEVDIYRESSY